MNRIALVAAGLLAACAAVGPATAQLSGDKVVIGFTTDLSGVYADLDGPGGLDAIKMAVADVGGKVLGKPIVLLSADHQNKADIAAAKVREWIDTNDLDAVFGGVNSATAFAINRLTADKRRVYFNVSSGASRLGNEDCNPYAVHYSYDSTSLARGTAGTIVHGGGKSWYFLTADYAFGKSLEDESGAIVKDSGGTVLGSARHPLNASDFSSFLIQARTSNAKVLGIASAGGDAINVLKSAREFGIAGAMRVVGLALTISDIHGVGLGVAQGLVMTDHWYWNTNDDTRAFAKRYFALRKRMPTSLQAANYSAVRTYLKAVEIAETDHPDKVMSTLKSMKIDDFYNKGYIRKDGRFVHDMYVFEAKRPSESATPWDYLRLIRVVPGEEAFQLPAQPKCALWKKDAT
jgi:branched-chain amino acid transport system substrate-binding protein